MHNEKRILFIDEDQGRHGSTVSMEYLAQEFNLNNYEVFVLSWKQDEKSKSILRKYATLINGKLGPVTTITLCVHFTYNYSLISLNGINLLLKDLVKFIIGTIIIFKEIKKFKPNLVYLNEYSVIQGSIAAYINKIPSVIHIRSLIATGILNFRRIIISKFILQFNNAIFAISKIEAEQLIRKKKSDDKIKIIGEFFPNKKTENNKDNYKAKYGLPLNKKNVLMLGGIMAIKGTLEFLQAAQSIIMGYQNVHFIIAGGDLFDKSKERRLYYDDCMKLYNEINLDKNKNVSIVGDITNSLELIAASDIIVSPSTQTHFSRPVIEAWGFGKPVVATKTAHMNDLITDGVNGLLVDVHDYKALARCILTLLNDESLCKKLGSNGKQKVLEEYDAKTNTGKIVEICNSIIESSKNKIL